MKDRLITLLCALAAFIVSVFLLMPPPSPDSQASLPTTEDRGEHGLKGLYRWLEVNNIPVYSLRKRFTELTDTGNFAPSSGNLLILSMPQQRNALDSEWSALQDWVDRGNTVLVLGAGYFIPVWVEQGDCFCKIDQLLSGFDWDIDSNNYETPDQPVDKNTELNFKQTIDNFKQDLETFIPKQAKLQPQSKHTLLQSVKAVQSKITPSLLEQRWHINTENNSLALQLLSLPEQQDLTLLWQIEAGGGQIFLSLVPDLFSNETLNKADNARFFENILTQSLAVNGQVIFDDYHFGLSNLYDPEQFFGDSRLHKTLGFIGLLWLLYILGYSNRLAPVHEPSNKPSALDYVEAMAGFFSRRLDKKTLAQELARRLIHDIRQHRHLHDDQTVWQWLQQHPGLQAAQLTLLQKAERKQRIPIQQLTHIITEIRNKVFL